MGGCNGPGPFWIENNYLEASGENFMLGGTDPPIPGLIPGGVTFRRNYVTKPVSWRNPHRRDARECLCRRIEWRVAARRHLQLPGGCAAGGCRSVHPHHRPVESFGRQSRSGRCHRPGEADVVRGLLGV